MPSTLKLNLYDNARVFLVEAFRYVTESHEGDVQWKFVILNLVQAIELLIKERLKREHPLFVFKDIDKREFTVSLSDGIKRLSSIAKVEIDEKDLEAVRLANRWRNEIVHYEVNIDLVEAKAAVARLIGFVVHFYRKQFGVRLADDINEGVWNSIVEIEAYAQELLERAKIRFREESIGPSDLWHCNKCGHLSFVHKSLIGECYVCCDRQTLISCEVCGKHVYADEGYHTMDEKRLRIFCKFHYDEYLEKYWALLDEL